MSQFIIDEKEYTINDITLRHYYELQHNIILSDNSTAYKICSVLTDCPDEILRKLSYEDFTLLLTKVNEKIQEGISPNSEFHPVIEVDGMELHFVDLDAMTIGEFLDLDIIISSPDAENKIHESLAILYRPKHNGELEPYDNKKSNSRHEALKGIKLTTARKAMSFFLDSGIQSLKRTLLSSMEALKELLSEENWRNLNSYIIQSLDLGTTHLSYYPDKTLLKSTELLNSLLEEHLISSRGDTTDTKKRKEKLISFLNQSKN